MGTNKLYYIDHSTKSTHWEYPYERVVSMLTSGNGSGGCTGKPEFTCDEDEVSYSDPRVEELVAIGISREAAVAAAKTNPIGDINDLIELILIKAKQKYNFSFQRYALCFIFVFIRSFLLVAMILNFFRRVVIREMGIFVLFV